MKTRGWKISLIEWKEKYKNHAGIVLLFLCQIGKWFEVIFPAGVTNSLKSSPPFTYDCLWVKAPVIKATIWIKNPCLSWQVGGFLGEVSVPVRLAAHPALVRTVQICTSGPVWSLVTHPLIPEVSGCGWLITQLQSPFGCWAHSLDIRIPAPSPTGRPGPGDINQLPMHSVGADSGALMTVNLLVCALF